MGRGSSFQRPHGQLNLVHPDGSALHRVPVGHQAPGAEPDVLTRRSLEIVFGLQRSDGAEIYMVRTDGTGLEGVRGAGRPAADSDWAASAR